MLTLLRQKYNSPANLLLLMMFIMTIGFAVWQALLNNFVIHRAQFTGVEIGILQSVREIPGFLAFTAVFFLLVLREQSFALISIATMLLGVAITGLFPFASGLYITTLLMSIGFHYFEAINKSLTLQWMPKDGTAHFMGKALAVKAAASIAAYLGIIFLVELLSFDYSTIYILVGTLGLLVLVAATLFFSSFTGQVEQHKTLILRKRYWLYYALTFLSGARRQIFVVFAGFMMVEKFDYTVSDISKLFLITYVFNLLFASHIGRWIGKIGERRALWFEYTGLVGVFVSYAFVNDPYLAAGLYVVDHLFFAFAIAIHTYFQKIADPKDIASSASVSFTINHIAAVFIPALMGMVWVSSPSSVFLFGAAIALISLSLSTFIPSHPDRGRETVFKPKLMK